MEVLTEWTTSSASSALHLQGLSQQDIFLLHKNTKKLAVFIILSYQTRMYIMHIYVVGVHLAYHSIPPVFFPFCTSALQCSWVDIMISAAKSYHQRQRHLHFFRSNPSEPIEYLPVKMQPHELQPYNSHVLFLYSSLLRY